MAKLPNVNRNTQFQRQRQEQPQSPPERDRYTFRISWLMVPVCILGMWYVLSHIHPVLSWEAVMDLLNVHNQERYTRLAVFCLILVFIVAAVRILGKKDD